MKKFLSLLRPLWLKNSFTLMVILLGFHAATWAQLPTAQQVASQIKVGWNIGNSLEAPPGETSWGNPMVSQTLINSVKNAGFNAVRIPCAWDSHQTNGVIHASWLARVKQVVDYCVNNNMYAIINIHWDGGWLEEHPFYSHQSAVNAKQRNYWTQIANYFKGYNERLLFAGTNEVRADYNTPTTEHINVQQSYLQTFVDAVRATGGNNATRPLIVQTYNTNAQHGINYFWLPSDPAANRLIVEIHNYDPYDFTLNSTGGCLYWGSPYPSQSACSWAQEAYINDYYNKVKAEWVDKGVPVIVGEYCANLRSGLSGTQLSNHQGSRQYWTNYVTKAAYQRGIKSFYWDNGVRSNGGAAIFDRNSGAVVDQGVLNAIMTAVSTSPMSITIQENTTGYCSANGTIDSNNGGFTGAGFINTNNAVGAGAVWRINVPASGAYTLTWRHANGGGANRPARLLANGTQILSTINFNATANWTTWAEVSVSVNLNAGQNTLRLESTTASGTSNIDFLRVAGNNPTAVSCSGVAGRMQTEEILEQTSDEETTSVEVAPNPTTGEVTITLPSSYKEGEKSVNLMDGTGKTAVSEKFSGLTHTLNIGSLSSGMYVLKVTSNKKLIVKKVIKK